MVRLRPDAVVAPTGRYVRWCKPALDRVFAAAAAVCAVVPMVIIAVVVAVSLGRPVLYRQRRVGRHGEVFVVLKFRTMRHDRRTESRIVDHERRRVHKAVGDPRHTGVGRVLRKYSLDELPQIYNVLLGDMSLVGPRPELESIVDNYPQGLARRHEVKPGLTGLWQINARGDGPMHENGEWDLAYVERVSLRTDIGILLRTPAALFGDGAGS